MSKAKFQDTDCARTKDATAISRAEIMMSGAASIKADASFGVFKLSFEDRQPPILTDGNRHG
jgi:hypothetical protein